jgi:DNA-binding GntR family transcriptional regulator
LPSERALHERFKYARSVIRQALAALIRDGLVMPAYPHGHYVVGSRIPWISRLRLLRDERWTVSLPTIVRTTASREVAEALQIDVGSPVIERQSELQSQTTGDLWGLGVVRYPSGELTDAEARILLRPDEIAYDDLERAFQRKITSYHERLIARRSSAAERRVFGSTSGLPVLEVQRIAHTTTTPISVFRFVGRSDCFEADYLLQV